MAFFTGTAKPHQGKKFLREVVSSWHKQLSYTCQKWKFLYYAGKKDIFRVSCIVNVTDCKAVPTQLTPFCNAIV